MKKQIVLFLSVGFAVLAFAGERVAIYPAYALTDGENAHNTKGGNVSDAVYSRR